MIKDSPQTFVCINKYGHPLLPFLYYYEKISLLFYNQHTDDASRIFGPSDIPKIEEKHSEKGEIFFFFFFAELYRLGEIITKCKTRCCSS